MSAVLQALTHELYEAVGSTSAWEVFLDSLATALGGVAPAIFVNERATDRPLLTLTRETDAAATRLYHGYYHRFDLRRPRIQALPAGTVFTGQQLLSDRELERSEFYQDFLRPRGLYHIGGGVAVKDETQIVVVRLMRERQAGAFGRRQLAIIHQLLPHLRRALRLHQELAQARARADATKAILERFPACVILVDARTRIVAANESAQALLARDDGLLVRGGHLVTSEGRETGALEALVQSTIRRQAADGAMTAQRPSGRSPLLLRVEPLPAPSDLDPDGRAAAMVMVSDAEDRAGPPASLLCRYFGLTPAEARVAVQIAQGRDLPDTARELGVEPDTVRTQLKRVFLKTRTHRQADLVRIVLSIPTRDDVAVRRTPDGERRPPAK